MFILAQVLSIATEINFNEIIDNILSKLTDMISLADYLVTIKRQGRHLGDFII